MSVKLKKISAWLLIILGCVFTFVFGIQIFTDNGLDKTMAHSREIEATFNDTAQFIDSFKKENSKFPTDAEIQNFLKINHPQFVETISVNSNLGEIPKFINERPSDSYYLTYWRGEWAEYYAGWSKQSTLNFDKNSYYSFGSKTLTILAAFLSWVLIAVGIFLKKQISK